MALLAPPLPDYDALTAAEVVARLSALAPADLRRVREYERRNGNRVAVLAAVERALAAAPPPARRGERTAAEAPPPPRRGLPS